MLDPERSKIMQEIADYIVRLIEGVMEINCFYCSNCGVLWDAEDIENGLCFDCEQPTIPMVARPTLPERKK